MFYNYFNSVSGENYLLFSFAKIVFKPWVKKILQFHKALAVIAWSVFNLGDLEPIFIQK